MYCIIRIDESRTIADTTCMTLAVSDINKRGDAMKISTVKSNGKTIRTWDNPLNTWVRSIDDGKMYRVDR